MRTSILLALSLGLFLISATAAEQKSEEAVLHVVRDFYAWYAPPPGGNERGLKSVLKDRASSLTNELLRALKQDYDAQSRSPDDIVGLDFDPFLNSQDPCEHYEVGKATRKGAGYLVEVYAVCAGTKSKQPSIIAELVPKNNLWVFANFHYPMDKTDLLQVLKLLRDQRRKH